ncbi:MAG: hypothetical protein IIC73_06255 [Armatimonadetes bacterium]|nr:hypothetical protein [Armatimonadota bacterium]
MPGAFSGISMAGNALRFFQRALETSGHNIANVSTPGYSRQTVAFKTSIPLTIYSGGSRRWAPGSQSARSCVPGTHTWKPARETTTGTWAGTRRCRPPSGRSRPRSSSLGTQASRRHSTSSSTPGPPLGQTRARPQPTCR